MTTKNLKPFDLEKALAGEPVVTREGYSAKIVYQSYNLILVVINFDNHDFSKWFKQDGKSDDRDGNDLFMAPKTTKLWIGVRKINYEDKHYFSTHAYLTKERAESAVSDKGDWQFIEIEVEDV